MDKNEIVKIYEEILMGKRKAFPTNFWRIGSNKEKARILIHHLIEKKLHWSKEDIKEKLSTKIFRNNGLKTIEYIFRSSYKIIENAYPGEFKPWEIKMSPRKIWKGKKGLKMAQKATRWLIEEKLHWKDKDIKERLAAKTFQKNDLDGMLHLFHGSPYQAIENAYPGRFRPWEFKRKQQCIWRKKQGFETAKKATKWLIEEKLGWDDEKIKKELKINTFTAYTKLVAVL